MKPAKATPRRRLRASSLLAGTSLAALLLAAPAHAGAGRTITTPQAAITNAGSTNFIVINGTTIVGAVTNTGTITPGTGWRNRRARGG